MERVDRRRSRVLTQSGERGISGHKLRERERNERDADREVRERSYASRDDTD